MADDLPNPRQRISDSSHGLRPHDKPVRKILLMKYIFTYGGLFNRKSRQSVDHIVVDVMKKQDKTTVLAIYEYIL